MTAGFIVSTHLDNIFAVPDTGRQWTVLRRTISDKCVLPPGVLIAVDILMSDIKVNYLNNKLSK